MKQKLILCGAISLFVLKHSTAQTSLGTFDPEIKAEVFLGGTASLSSGKFIKDHKEFHEINYADADISGKVKPIIFFDAGVQGRMIAGQEGLLSQLSVSIGMFYSKSGFNHVYSYSSDNATLDITNKMDYSERYVLNHISVPILIRYGKKWFVEAGPSIDHFISASRKQKLTRKTSGSDAFDGGFSTTEEDKQKLDKGIFKEHPVGFILGLGTTVNDRFSVRLTNHLFSKAFEKGNNFSSYNAQIEIMFNIFKTKIND